MIISRGALGRKEMARERREEKEEILVMACFPDVPAPEELSLFTCINCVIIAFCAVVGNTFVITTIIKEPLSKLHTPFNFLLINLALSDFILGVIAAPVGVYMHYEAYIGEIPKHVVKLRHMSVFISGTASISHYTCDKI